MKIKYKLGLRTLKHEFSQHDIDCGRCPHCGNHAFEWIEIQDEKSIWKCLKCGAEMTGEFKPFL
jgi:ribosomal protein L37AE/L43A